MFDIKPIKNQAVFKFDENNRKSSNETLEDQEFLLVEALREQEGIDDLEKINQIKKENKIKKEAGQFNNVHLDHYFSDKDIPTQVISEGRIDEPAKYLPKKKSREDYCQGESFELKQIELEKEIIEKKELRLKEKRKAEAERERQIISQKEKARVELEKIERKERKEKEFKLKEKIKAEAERERQIISQKEKAKLKLERIEKKIKRDKQLSRIRENLLAKPGQIKNSFNFFTSSMAFSGACLAIFITVFSLRFVFYGFQIKDQVIVKGASVVSDLNQAKNNFQDKNFSQIVSDFKNVQKEIDSINQDLEKMEGGLPDIINKLPFISRYGNTKKILVVGDEISQAMILISQVIDDFSDIENPLNFENVDKDSSLGDFFVNLEKQLILAESHLELAQKKLDEINPSDLPEEYRERVVVLKTIFPEALSLLVDFNQKQFIFQDLLGYNGPRKYLFLFQNNHEARATGGFIGSYGVLTVHDGNVKDLFVDGIFNPDGQLSTRVVPPRPIQKISTNWSTHDANWFPDFPTSAEKIAWFYEKTGGPTVDGIITLTPTVMEKLLEITGPIEMLEYGVTVDCDNFIEATQFEVEENYDKNENRPKKFIADLTPKILDKIFSKEGLTNFPKSLQVLSEALSEKHILIYSENHEIQKMISNLGWSGEVLKTPKDYLMVVNSNINGYKTDGVIDQKINHEIEIEPDGSIIDKVTIERFHNGGSSEYEWWNKVNANYMRVYVPQGSELLEAKGYTRETTEEPVDYDKLGFIRDSLVTDLEKKIEIDDESGTEIWDEANKTVFANWVYVSPQETVKVSYKYKLPFKLVLNREEEKMDIYSVLYQKQSGMNTSELKTKLQLSNNQDIFWKYPDELKDNDKNLSYNDNLEKDRFIGVVLK